MVRFIAVLFQVKGESMLNVPKIVLFHIITETRNSITPRKFWQFWSHSSVEHSVVVSNPPCILVSLLILLSAISSNLYISCMSLKSIFSILKHSSMFLLTILFLFESFSGDVLWWQNLVDSWPEIFPDTDMLQPAVFPLVVEMFRDESCSSSAEPFFKLGWT